jgi:hypothetical protein
MPAIRTQNRQKFLEYRTGASVRASAAAGFGGVRLWWKAAIPCLPLNVKRYEMVLSLETCPRDGESDRFSCSSQTRRPHVSRAGGT